MKIIVLIGVNYMLIKFVDAWIIPFLDERKTKVNIQANKLYAKGDIETYNKLYFRNFLETAGSFVAWIAVMWIINYILLKVM